MLVRHPNAKRSAGILTSIAASKNHMARVMDDCLLLTGIALQDRMKCCLEAMRVLSQQRADEKKESAPYKV